MNFESLGRIYSREQMRSFGKRIHSSGILVSPEGFMGYVLAIMLTTSFFLALVLFLLPSTQKYFISLIANVFFKFAFPVIVLNVITFAAIFVFSLALTSFATYVIVSAVLILLSEARKKMVESVLPDFLTLLGANVRAGMTLDQAIWYAAKPEYGILSTEIRIVIKGAFSGEPLNSALDRLSERFDSKLFERTISLIKQASLTGGEIAKILEITASDARKSATLKKEISASLLIYEIFVLFSAALGAPFLFAVVNKLFAILEKSFASLPQTSASFSSFSKPTAPLITSTEFFYFSIVVIFITTFFSSLIIGIVQSGSKNQGLKYFPFIVLIAYLVFFGVSYLFESFFASMLQL